VHALAVSPDGRTLAVGGSDGALELLDSATRRRIGAVERLGAAISAVRFSPDGTRLAVSGVNADVGLVDAPGSFVELIAYEHGRLARPRDRRHLRRSHPAPARGPAPALERAHRREPRR
jgi:hypothetical protein